MAVALASARPARSSRGKRMLRRGWAVCFCAAICGRVGNPGERGGPAAGANAFALVVPSPSPAVLRSSQKPVNKRFSTGGETCGSCGESSYNTGRRRSRRVSVALAANRRPASSYAMSPDLSEVADVVRQQTKGRLPKESFIVYNGPAKSSKPPAVVKAQIMEERRLGARIQESVRLVKIKQHLEEGLAGEVSTEAWAQAAGQSVKALKHNLRIGDEARQSLVELNLGLVKNIVYTYWRGMANGQGSRGTGNAAHFSRTDLLQEATMGLIRAVEKFDPSRGFRFCTYAQWWVRKYLNECIQNQNRLIRIPVYLAHRLSRVNRATTELTSDLDREPTLEELAFATGYSVAQVEACLEQRSLGVSSLDAVLGSNSNRYGSSGGLGYSSADGRAFNLMDTVASQDDDVGGDDDEYKGPNGAEYLQRQLRADLSRALSRILDDREKQCLVLRYGLEDGVTKTMEETGRIMDIGLNEVHTLSRRSMSKLREGTLPEERAKLMSYLSIYEPESLPSSHRRPNPSPNTASAYSYRPRDSRVGNEEDDMCRDAVESERLEEELARYLRARGITKDFSHRNDDDYGDLSLEELNLGSDRIPEPQEPVDDLEEKDTSGKKKGSGGWGKGVLARSGGARVVKLSQSGGSKNEGSDSDVSKEDVVRKNRIDRNNPRAKFIGEAEPRPNSREAIQLEHLSRLLFDGDEPQDFVFGQSTLQ